MAEGDEDARGGAVDETELLARYRERLPRLAMHLIRLADRRDPASRRLARVEAHRLKGTAGSYGFADIAEAVQEIEDLLVESPGDRALEGALGQLRELVETL